MKKSLFLLCAALLAPLAATAQVSNVVHSTALEASHVLQTTQGALLSLNGYNSKGSAQFIQIHDAAAVPGNLTAEVFTVDFTGKTPAGLANKYFLTADDAGSVYIWFNLDSGGVDPAPAGIARGIAVPITTGHTAGQLASDFATAVDPDSKFAATAVSNVVTVTNSVSGARTDVADGNSTLTLLTTVQGIDSAVPVLVITAAASSNFSITLDISGLPCAHGIVVCNSSTSATKTGGSADCFFTATCR